MKTVTFTRNQNLCISCGICEGICPNACITMEHHNGAYLPSIKDSCINCGLCFAVCPGKGKIRQSSDELNEGHLLGTYLCIYNAWSKNDTIRHYGASGGVITTLVHRLLQMGLYEYAFVVEDFSYDQYVHTVKIDKNCANLLLNYDDDNRFASKSRYIPVGHGNTIRYMLENPQAKVIIIGTPCSIRGILNVINVKKLNRSNYLLIGLFCESIMSYNVWKYFSQKKFTKGKELTAIHFKNKESGGWPGDIKMVFSDGSYRYYDESYRIEIKKYFKPERCLYCVDKLNINADISVGDNYTGIDDSILGSNTVIVRSELGKRIWNVCIDEIESKEINFQYVMKAQSIGERIMNITYARYKECQIKNEAGIELDINAMDKICLGDIDMEKYTLQMKDLHRGGDNSWINQILTVPHAKKKIKKFMKRGSNISDVLFNMMNTGEKII